MKRFAAISLACIMMFSLTICAFASSSPNPIQERMNRVRLNPQPRLAQYVKTTANVNLRKGAGLGYDVIEVVPKNSYIYVMLAAEDSSGYTWYYGAVYNGNGQITGGSQGYVRSDNVEPMPYNWLPWEN